MSRQQAMGDDSVLVPTSALSVMTGIESIPTALSTKRPILSARAVEWCRWMAEHGYPAYRGRQVLDWVFRRRAESFEAMSDLPKSLRQAA